MFKKSLLLPLLFAGLPLACTESATTPDAGPSPAPTGKVTQLDIVDRSIAAHGGDLFHNSHVTLTVTSKSGSFDIDTKTAGGAFEHRIIEQDDGSEKVHIRTNDELIVTMDGLQVAMPEAALERAESYVNQRMYFLFLPYKLNDPGVYKEDFGLETWGDRELHKVRISFEPDTSDGAASEYMYWFDPETARLEQFAYDYSEGTGLRFRQLFNYREVGGLTFYDAENYGLNNEEGGLTVNSITPDNALETLPKVSTITLSNIEVVRASS